MLTKEKLKSEPSVKRLPHVTILGAGASKAAMLDGDRYGKIIPLMDDLPNILSDDWKNLIREAQPPQGNFEATFSWIKKNGKFEQPLLRIEKLIEKYFQGLELPDHPTIYDYLVLGLRGNDIIATFNWDPFLMQAHMRNRDVAELPDIRFLHGCVAFATCSEHDILGCPLEVCPECHRDLDQGHLFYPEEDKDYVKDSIIYRDWEVVTKKLQKAFHLTIFGYSGPVTDYNARKLLLDGWIQTPIRDIGHVEIIDIIDEENLRENWAEFIPFDHDMIIKDFWGSTIARWPRRTYEYKMAASRYGMPAEFLGPFRADSLRELQDYISEIVEFENQ